MSVVQKSIQETLEPLKLKQKELNTQNPARTIELGTTNLGTFWVIEFATIQFGAVSGTNKTKAKTELKPEVVARLFEDNFLVASSRHTLSLKFVEPEESQTLEPVELSFNFAQPPIIHSGHSLVLEYSTTFLTFGTIAGTGISSLNLEAGQVSIGYSLADGNIGRNVYATR